MSLRTAARHVERAGGQWASGGGRLWWRGRFGHRDFRRRPRWLEHRARCLAGCTDVHVPCGRGSVPVRAALPEAEVRSTHMHWMPQHSGMVQQAVEMLLGTPWSGAQVQPADPARRRTLQRTRATTGPGYDQLYMCTFPVLSDVHNALCCQIPAARSGPDPVAVSYRFRADIRVIIPGRSHLSTRCRGRTR